MLNEARIYFLAKAAVENSADPTDALVILLSGPLSQLHGRPFIPAELSQQATAFYGWSISSDVIEFVTDRLRKQGWLKVHGELRGPLYVDLPDPIAEDANTQTIDQLVELGAAFRSYASELSPISVLPDDPTDCATSLLRYAVRINAIENADRMASDTEYLCARFFEFINDNDPKLAKMMGSLSALGFLSFISEDFSKPRDTRIADLKVIVDGPVLLDYLECSGKARAGAPQKLFDDLRSMGCQIVTFTHCVREAQHALKTVLRTDRAQRYGPTGDALKRGLVREDRLEGILKNFEAAIKQSQITILPDNIDLFPSNHQYFTKEQAKSVVAMINWHDGDNEDAIYADADTITLTIRRRSGHRTTDLFDSKFVAATNNNTYFSATRRFLNQNFVYTPSQIPPVISLQELAAKTWLEIGENREAGSELGLSHLLLACERSLRLNEDVVNRAREELAQISKEKLQEFELLLNVPRSVRAVVDKTLNNANYVTSDSIESLVDAAIHAAAEQVTQKEKQKRSDLNAKHYKELEERELTIQNERLRRESAEERIASLRDEFLQKDNEIIFSATNYASARLDKIINSSRVFGFFSFISPLIIFFLQPQSQWNIFSGFITVLAVIASLLMVADYPGNWVSNWLKSFLLQSVEKRFREIGRHDLIDAYSFEWHDRSLRYERKA